MVYMTIDPDGEKSLSGQVRVLERELNSARLELEAERGIRERAQAANRRSAQEIQGYEDQMVDLRNEKKKLVDQVIDLQVQLRKAEQDAALRSAVTQDATEDDITYYRERADEFELKAAESENLVASLREQLRERTEALNSARIEAVNRRELLMQWRYSLTLERQQAEALGQWPIVSANSAIVAVLNKIIDNEKPQQR